MRIFLDMEARRDFFLVFKEAVNNAAKYSKAAKVHISLSTALNKLVLVVKDNGVGFTIAEADNGNGLGNMQKRTEGMNGKLLLQSKPGEGTQITLTIPVQ
jgi:signal transduction histidine kinase